MPKEKETFKEIIMILNKVKEQILAINAKTRTFHQRKENYKKEPTRNFRTEKYNIWKERKEKVVRYSIQGLH